MRYADYSPDLAVHSVYRLNKVQSLTSTLTNCCGACGTAATRFRCTLHVPLLFSFLQRPQNCLHHELNIRSCSAYVILYQKTSSYRCTEFNTHGQEESATTAGIFLCAREVCPSITIHVLKLATHETLNLRNSNKADRYQALITEPIQPKP